jgi:hypothetical protein
MLIELAQRLKQPPFLEPGGLICKRKVPAGVILTVEEPRIPFANNLEVTLWETLGPLVFIYKIVSLIVIIQFIEPIDIVVCIHFGSVPYLQ